jgi:protein arginine kinase
VEKTPKIDLPAFKQPWEKNTNSIWLASTLCLHRNINKFHFPNRLDVEKRRLVANLILGALRGSSALAGLITYSGEDLSPLDRDLLAEHFLVFEPMKDSQHGHYYGIEDTGSLLIQVNAKDHLELHTVEVADDLEKALSRLVAVERDVEKKLPFSFSQQFGYLTSDPFQCGTALQVCAYLHIPALVFRGILAQSFEKESQEGLSFTSLQGNPEDLIGDLLVIRNRYTIGVTEEVILSAIRNTVLRIIMEEKAFRLKMQEDKDDRAIDRVSRAIGILQHSFTIDTGESLRALSLLKFGIELGWIKGMGVEEVNEIFFDCRRAHLAKAQGRELYGSPQLNKTRAQMFRERAASIELTA